jgi:hypothetical protein
VIEKYSSIALKCKLTVFWKRTTLILYYNRSSEASSFNTLSKRLSLDNTSNESYKCLFKIIKCLPRKIVPPQNASPAPFVSMIFSSRGTSKNSTPLWLAIINDFSPLVITTIRFCFSLT